MPINYSIEYPAKVKRIQQLETESKRYREALEEIEELGHSTHHAKGYTLANIAKEALTNDS